MILLAFDDHLLMDVEPESRGFLLEHLDRYIIADDVALEDITDSTVEIGVEGVEPPEGAPYSHTRQGNRVIVRASSTGLPGSRVIAPAAEREAIIRELALPELSPEEARVARMENGVPRFPEDFSDRHLAHETQLLHAVHFNKGCYLGQEIVERVRSRGGVHRFLVRLAADREIAPGTKLTFEGREAGEVTSLAFSTAQGRWVGLGYVRLHEVPAGAVLNAGGAKVTVRQE
jgi:aminomethyltransferase